MRPLLFAVADGMGGAKAGEVASRVAIETLIEHLPRLSEAGEEEAGTALATAADDANARVYALSLEHRAHAGMGTTLTALLLTRRGARLAHIGDSRAYVYRDRVLEQITDDHSLVGEMTRNGELSPEEAADHPLRSVLSRALGTEPEVEIDLLEVDLQAGDTLLLCSDGLSGVVAPDRLAALVADPDPAAAAERLIRAALAQGGPDNITAVVVKLDEVEDEDTWTAAGRGAVSEEMCAAGDEEDGARHSGAQDGAGAQAAGATGDDDTSAGALRAHRDAGVAAESEGNAGSAAGDAAASGPGPAPAREPVPPAAVAGESAGPAVSGPSGPAEPAEAAEPARAAGRRGGWWRSRRRDHGR